MLELQAPSSKSVSHRMVIGAALAAGHSSLYNVLESQDLEQTMTILQAAGAKIKRTDAGTYSITGTSGTLRGGKEAALSCDVHESGTTCRLLTALLAAGQGRFAIHGAPRMHKRPIGELTSALEALGVTIHFVNERGYPPLEIQTTGLHGSHVTIGMDESSQYLSGLLLAAPQAEQPLTIEISGTQVVSWPYIGLTLDLLETFGVPFHVERLNRESAPGWEQADWRNLNTICPGELRFCMQPATFQAGKYTVEGDWSGASYLLAAGTLGKHPLRILGLNPKSLQGDRAILDCLSQMGARIEIEEAITVYPSLLHGATLNMENCPDLVPTLATLAAFAEGSTLIQGVAHLRIKESDRIAAPVQELRRIGITAHERPDGLYVEGNKSKACCPETVHFSAHGDHRIAMSLALLEAGGGRVKLDDPACVRKSFPHFWAIWDEVRTLF